MHPVLSLFILLALFTGTRIYMPVDNQARIYVPVVLPEYGEFEKKTHDMYGMAGS